MIDQNELERLSNPREALEEAFKVVFGPKPDTIWKDEVLREEWTDEYSAWFARSCRFYTLLDAEAWTDAAMMLVQGPAEYPGSKTFLIDCATQTSVYSQPVAYVWDERGKHMGKGKTPAIALAQAALRAKEAGDE